MIRTVRSAPAVALLVATAACGGASHPLARPSSSVVVTTASPSASLSPAGSPSPTGFVFDQASAIAFVESYFDVTNTAFATGKTDKARAFFSMNCNCAGQLDLVDKIYGQGQHLEGGVQSVIDFDVQVGATNRVTYKLTTAANQVVDANGKVLASSPEISKTENAFLVHNDSDSGWLFDRVTDTPS